MLNGSYPPGNISLERLKGVFIRFVAIFGGNNAGQNNMGKDSEFAVSGLPSARVYRKGFIESDPLVSTELQQYHKHPPGDISFD
jgi:hypothetical protein